MNKVMLIGRITRDIEQRKTQDGKAIAKFTLAVDRRTKKDEADFISCTAWERTAELIGKYLGKGAKIAVNGRIQTGSYTKQDGTKNYTTDVIVEDVEFLDSKPKEQSDGFVPMPENDDSGLPF